MPRKGSKGNVGAVISGITSDLTFRSWYAAFTTLISVKSTRFPITRRDCVHCPQNLRTESWPKLVGRSQLLQATEHVRHPLWMTRGSAQQGRHVGKAECLVYCG